MQLQTVTWVADFLCFLAPPDLYAVVVASQTVRRFGCPKLYTVLGPLKFVRGGVLPQQLAVTAALVIRFTQLWFGS